MVEKLEAFFGIYQWGLRMQSSMHKPIQQKDTFTASNPPLFRLPQNFGNPILGLILSGHFISKCIVDEKLMATGKM